MSVSLFWVMMEIKMNSYCRTGGKRLPPDFSIPLSQICASTVATALSVRGQGQSTKLNTKHMRDSLSPLYSPGWALPVAPAGTRRAQRETDVGVSPGSTGASTVSLLTLLPTLKTERFQTTSSLTALVFSDPK